MKQIKNDILVRTVCWDIHARSVATGMQWQDSVSSFSHSNLPTIIENTLRRYNRDEDTITLSRLALDLGTISDEFEIGARVEEMLKRAFEDNGSAITTKHGEFHHVANQGNVSCLTQFKFYLIHGYLDWNADTHQFKTSAEVFGLLTDLDDQAFIAWYAQLVASRSSRLEIGCVVNRFIEFFSVDELVEIGKKFARVSPTFNQLIEHMESLLTSLPVTKSLRFAHLRTIAEVGSNESADFEDMVLFWWKSMEDVSIYDARGVKEVRRRVENVSEEDEGNEANVFLVNIHRIVMPSSNTSEKHFLDEATSESVSVKVKSNQQRVQQREFFVENAGVVLLYPFLKRLFHDKGLVDEANDFIDHTSRMSACRLIQHLVSPTMPVLEFQLVLPKVLCGYGIDDAIVDTALASMSIQESNEFLASTYDGWEKVKRTSPDGFRESFLKRSGKLYDEQHNWLLMVERKAWDILLETIPYPLSVIKLPWMTKPIYVQW
ncbi:contractile injection system tape measure protein [Pseudochryseolinea flava]|uniref:Uncharacterized protein n=1 Tax=Pseudochryseolinea flava TaxID=2059302 RepID=A0A364Y494_9BACT|nr:contractile injection system tape measure protein [Pseudochryseolinea flava]RAW01586.1 hypothetical protein DQQ10_07970 [Pseudochryseolinea flava]